MSQRKNCGGSNVAKEKLWWFERRKGKIVVIRIRLGQYNEGFLFMEEAFVVLCRKGENCGTSLMCVVFPKTQRGR